MADEAQVANNPAPADTPAAAEPELALEPELTADSTSEGQPEGQAPEDEFEEVEWDGKKGRVSKALKDGYLRQADYTRKSQEVAEMRKAAEAQNAQIAEQAQTFQRHAIEVAELVSLNKQLAAYEKATPEDWQRWAESNAADTQKAWLLYQTLKDQRGSLAQRLQQQEQKWQFEAQSSETKRIEEGRKAIAAKVPGWNAELEAKLHKYAVAEGFPEKAWEKATDPVAMNTLRKAYLYDQLVAKQRAATQAASSEPVAPVAPVGGNRAPSRDFRSLASRDTEAAIKLRNEQVRRRAH